MCRDQSTRIRPCQIPPHIIQFAREMRCPHRPTVWRKVLSDLSQRFGGLKDSIAHASFGFLHADLSEIGTGSNAGIGNFATSGHTSA